MRLGLLLLIFERMKVESLEEEEVLCKFMVIGTCQRFLYHFQRVLVFQSCCKLDNSSTGSSEKG